MILETKNFTIWLDEEERGQGYFEHNHYGDDFAGGLWYDIIDSTLTDYDGVYELPMEIITALRHEGRIHVPLVFEPDNKE